jgi:hypothetical protein
MLFVSKVYVAMAQFLDEPTSLSVTAMLFPAAPAGVMLSSDDKVTYEFLEMQ